MDIKESYLLNLTWSSFEIPFRMNQHAGKLLCFEGVDGSGKSSLINRTVQYLQSRGIPSEITITPTIEVRQLPYWQDYANPKTDRTRFDPLGLELIAFGDRLVHQERFIEPLLEKGIWVLCDRYILNSLVYSQEDTLLKYLPRFLKPDVGILIDVDMRVAEKRIAERGEVEHENDVTEKIIIKKRYLELANDNAFISIDTTNKSVDDSFLVIESHINIFI